MKTIIQKLKQIPKMPGVYTFKDHTGNIIYIGKAKNLFNRVHSYFSKTTDVKTHIMVKKIHNFEYFITNNEVEALLLENNLIKQYDPKYNFKLRDAKSFPMLKITKENLPRIIKCREINRNPEDEYYGPFINVQSITYLQKVFQKILKIRSCNKHFTHPYNYTPCLNYHIGKCSAPCASYISETDYLQSIETARQILQGNTDSVISLLNKKMQNAALNLEYEQAALIRDQIKLLQEYSSLQCIDTLSSNNSDYIGIFTDFKSAAISLIQVRNGKITGKENFLFSNIIYTSALIDFMNLYYLNITNFPTKIFIQQESDETNLLLNAIKLKFNKNIEIIKPVENTDKKILLLAKENAEIYFEERQFKLEQIHVLREMKKILNLPHLPRNIEGFDIATLNGKYNTAALVSFIDGKSNKTGYRQFNIDNQAHPDDYAMMKEVIARRFQRLKNEKMALPDLILIDGGKGQVNAANEILTILNLTIPVVGLAKKEEHLFYPNQSEPIILDKNSNILKILQKIRDEAHRFSNTRLKKRYTRKNLESDLLSISGLGKKRVNLLFIKFGSIKSLQKATVEQIANIEGIGAALAKKIFAFLHE